MEVVVQVDLLLEVNLQCLQHSRLQVRKLEQVVDVLVECELLEVELVVKFEWKAVPS